MLPFQSRTASSDVEGRDPFYLSYYAWALARSGRIEEARACLGEVETRAQTEYVQYLRHSFIPRSLK